jgi:hypothetical protein
LCKTTTVRRDSDYGWWLDVNSSAQFTRGPARVHAVVVVRKTDGATFQWPWSFNVQLVQPDPALELDEIQGNILAIGPRSSVMLATTNRVSGQVA